jgi:hypothetical protein
VVGVFPNCWEIVAQSSLTDTRSAAHFSRFHFVSCIPYFRSGYLIMVEKPVNFLDAPRLVSGPPVASQPRTETGRSWANAYLHPPSATSGAGFPDMDCTPSAILVIKFTQNFTTPDVTSAWNLHLCGIPSPQTPFVYTTEKVGATLPDIAGCNLVQINDATFWATLRGSSQAFRVVAQSDTLYLNASATTNQGMLVASQVRPDRKLDSTTTAAASNFNTLQLDVAYDDNPLNAGNLASLPGAVQWQARFGAFIPRRMHSTNLPYTDTSGHGWRVVNIKTGSFLGDAAANYSSLNEFDVPMVNFLGLDPAASVTLKSIVVMEIQPGPNSIYSALANTVTRPDPDAIAWACEQSYMQPLVLPSSGNDWGSFLQHVLTEGSGLLAGLIPGVGGAAAPIARNAVANYFKSNPLSKPTRRRVATRERQIEREEPRQPPAQRKRRAKPPPSARTARQAPKRRAPRDPLDSLR